jgi:hypothetical protein
MHSLFPSGEVQAVADRTALPGGCGDVPFMGPRRELEGLGRLVVGSGGRDPLDCIFWLSGNGGDRRGR